MQAFSYEEFMTWCLNDTYDLATYGGRGLFVFHEKQTLWSRLPIKKGQGTYSSKQDLYGMLCIWHEHLLDQIDGHWIQGCLWLEVFLNPFDCKISYHESHDNHHDSKTTQDDVNEQIKGFVRVHVFLQKSYCSPSRSF